MCQNDSRYMKLVYNVLYYIIQDIVRCELKYMLLVSWYSFYDSCYMKLVELYLLYNIC